jgi:hypothetical protein
VDLILNQAQRLLPIEIKGGRTFDPSFTKNLQAFQKLTASVGQPTVIYAGDLTANVHGTAFVNFKDTASVVNSQNARLTNSLSG